MNIFRVNLFKSIYLNLRVFPFKTAMHLPIILGWHVKIHEAHKGTVQLDCKPKVGLLRFGCGPGILGVETNDKSQWLVKKGGLIILHGKAGFSKGVGLRCGEGGTIELGQNVHFNQNAFIACNNKISIGDDTIAGWNVRLQDADGHDLVDEAGNVTNPSKPIHIGKHVWLGYNAQLLKGAYIDDDNTVACNALVTKSFEGTHHAVIGGMPAKIIKEKVDWR